MTPLKVNVKLIQLFHETHKVFLRIKAPGNRNTNHGPLPVSPLTSRAANRNLCLPNSFKTTLSSRNILVVPSWNRRTKKWTFHLVNQQKSFSQFYCYRYYSEKKKQNKKNFCKLGRKREYLKNGFTKLMFSWKSDFEWVQLVSICEKAAMDCVKLKLVEGRLYRQEKLLSFWSHDWHEVLRRCRRWGLTDPINIVACFRFGSENSFKFRFLSFRRTFFFSLLFSDAIMGSVTDGNWIKPGDPWQSRLNETLWAFNTHPIVLYSHCFVYFKVVSDFIFFIYLFWISINFFHPLAQRLCCDKSWTYKRDRRQSLSLHISNLVVLPLPTAEQHKFNRSQHFPDTSHISTKISDANQSGDEKAN